MHSYHRSSSSSSSSSCLPSVCSFQTFIGLAVILCVYVMLQSSVTLNQKTPPSTSLHSSSRFDLDEAPSYDQPLFSRFNREENVNPAPLEEDVETLGGLAEVFEVSWGGDRGKIHDNGELLTLSLDNSSGSGFESKKEYLFAKIEMYIKLIPDNSAGTVTTFFLSSNGSTHDEIDFEFLGNVSGQPYTIHTNIYTLGKGEREQQFYLWFDPTKDFHSYSILWTPFRVLFLVDGVAIREFKNMENVGIPFPKNQPMKIYSSLWNADDWATQGGTVKTDWTRGPFEASFRNFSSSACVWSYGSSSCGPNPGLKTGLGNDWLLEELDVKSLQKMREIQEKYMTYDYCKDKLRYSEGPPKECSFSKSNED